VVILAQRVPNSGRSNREYDAGPVAGADPARINFGLTVELRRFARFVWVELWYDAARSGC